MLTHSSLKPQTAPRTLHVEAAMLLIYQELMGFFFAGPRCWGEAGHCEEGEARAGLGYHSQHLKVDFFISLFLFQINFKKGLMLT